MASQRKKASPTCPTCGQKVETPASSAKNPTKTASDISKTDGPPPDIQWVDLKPHWDALRKAADDRHNQKRKFKSSRYWNADSHFLGLLAEQVYATVTKQKVNLELIIQGDDGFDFPDTDVKGCKYWNDPWLKHPINRDLPVGKYVLVGLDVKKQRGYVVGWASKEDISQAEIVDWGYGSQRSIHWKNLRKLES